MSLKVFVIARDRDLRQLLTNILQEQGSSVQAFANPEFCCLFSTESSDCSHQKACCDALLIDYEVAWMTGLDLIEEQFQKRCKLAPAQKAFLSIAPDHLQMTRSREIGCRMVPKPFRLQMIKDWLDSCGERQDPSEVASPLGH